MPRKQKELTGMEGPGVAPMQIPELDAAAERYVGLRNKRMKLLTQEIESKDKLIVLLHAHEEKIGKGPDGSIKYEYEETLVELKPAGESLKVKTIKNGDE